MGCPYWLKLPVHFQLSGQFQRGVCRDEQQISARIADAASTVADYGGGSMISGGEVMSKPPGLSLDVEAGVLGLAT